MKIFTMWKRAYFVLVKKSLYCWAVFRGWMTQGGRFRRPARKNQCEHIAKVHDMKRWMGNQPARCRGDFRASHAQVCKGSSGLL